MNIILSCGLFFDKQGAELIFKPLLKEMKYLEGQSSHCLLGVTKFSVALNKGKTLVFIAGSGNIDKLYGSHLVGSGER